MGKCKEFGENFNWWNFFWYVTYHLDHMKMPEIIECYFLLQPEVTPNKIAPNDLSMLLKEPHIKLLKKKKFLHTEKKSYSLLELLQYVRLLLRFKWEKVYYGKSFKVIKEPTNIRLVRGVEVSEIAYFDGINEMNTKPHYIFNPLNLRYLKGKIFNLDEGMKKSLPSGDDTILIVPNARPELVKYFDMKGLLGFISEEGGATAHSIIVARERNIPCVVGVSGVMDKYKDGEYISINMETGEIQKEE